MLRRLPSRGSGVVEVRTSALQAGAPAQNERAVGETELLDVVANLIVGADPLSSALTWYAFEEEDGVLCLVRDSPHVESGGDAASQRARHALATIRRTGPTAYAWREL